jgi:hypothetical protein
MVFKKAITPKAVTPNSRANSINFSLSMMEVHLDVNEQD